MPVLCGLLGWTCGRVCHEHKGTIGSFDVTLLCDVGSRAVGLGTASLGVCAWACRFGSVLWSGTVSCYNTAKALLCVIISTGREKKNPCW
jgi:hypothetical protein